jgi:Txe/YoeB family toxin of Txe-Axe toxin-antitoxin module
MKLPSKIKFADEKVKAAFELLSNSTSEEKQLYKFLAQAFENLEQDAFTGTQIPKKLIPKEYARKYGIDNLWKYNLPNAWRLLYSVSRDEITVISIVLEWMKHKEYDRKFGYKTS